MSIEELPNPGGGRRPSGAPWTSTVLTLCAGVLLGVVMMQALDPRGVPEPSAVASASLVAAPASLPPATPRPTPRPANVVATSVLPSARHQLTVDGVTFSFAVPTGGWDRYGDLYISKSSHPPQLAEAMIFWARHPVGHSARACFHSSTLPIGHTPEQIATDLATGVPGTELVSGPTEVTVGGVAALQVVLFVRDGNACGPGLFYDWDGEEERGGHLWGGPLLGDTVTIWVLEVQGVRFLIAAETHLNAGAELEAEVLEIVNSIAFEEPETDPIAGGYRPGRHTITVDSTTFSFAVATTDWAPYSGREGTQDTFLLTRDTGGSQGAEEVIYWSGYPRSTNVTACGILENPPDPPRAFDVATRVASAGGTNLVTAPQWVTVGGHPAAHVAVTVRDAIGCDPGFFFSWEPQQGGTLWTETGVGVMIEVWVVEVDAGLFFIAAETSPDAGSHAAEIPPIIDSIIFD